jgi:hypothetical protein
VRRITSLLLALALSLAVVASAQQAPQPAQPGAAPGINQSMVRFVHASPNAEVARIVLTDTIGTAGFHEIMDLEYLEVTEYVPVLAGSYEITVELAADAEGQVPHIVEPATINTVDGTFHTVVLTGLVLPTEAVGRDDGFFAWLEGLFTDERQDLTLFPLVLDDLTQVAIAQNETEVRLVHAAPGTDTVDLVLVRPGVSEDVLHTEAYGNASGHTRIFPAEGHLEIRVAGSTAVLVDLAELDVTPGLIHTVILTGTPIEDEPLRAMLVSNAWVDPIATPGVPGAVAPMPGTLPAGEAAWIHDRLLEAQAWLADAEARLVTLTEVEGAQEQANAALDEVAAARTVIEEARIQLEALTVPGAPGAMPAQPAQPAQPGQPAQPAQPGEPTVPTAPDAEEPDTTEPETTEPAD